MDGFRNVDGSSNENFTYLLQLRESQVHFVRCLDTYSAFIVLNKIWNADDQLMEQFCRSDQVAFHEQILTISDREIIKKASTSTGFLRFCTRNY